MGLNSALARMMPDSLKFKLHRWIKNTSSYVAIGTKSDQVANSFDKLRDIPGWFTLDDCSHFHLVLEMQSLNGVTGDLFEIGSYHGRSTALMAMHLRDGERIHVCDAFEGDTDDSYANKPSPEKVFNNIKSLTPGFTLDRMEVYECLSNDIELPAEQKFRFIHIDGGHAAEQVYADLELCRAHLQPRGVIVIDDYYQPHWPGVGAGVDQYLAERPGLAVLGDMNRHGALGRKLYLYDTAGA